MTNCLQINGKKMNVQNLKRCAKKTPQKNKLNCVSEIKLKQSTQSFIKSGIYVTNLTLKEFLTHEWNMLSLIFLLASAR